MVYPNLEAELKRNGISRKTIAKDFGLALSTVYSRLSGRTALTVSFADALRKRYKIAVPLDELFAETRQ